MSEPVGPGEIAGHRVTATLLAGRTYRAVAPGGWGVILKRLPGECLSRGRLHPSVRRRLECVRELAHGEVAVLLGVEREGDAAWAVWEDVAGMTLEEWMACGPDDAAVTGVRREVELAVAGLHGLGIVHGAIHGRNVIVQEGGRVKLTHLGPLLHHAPGVDLRAVERLFGGVGPPSRQPVKTGIGESGGSIRRRALGLGIGAIVAGIVGAWWIAGTVRRANPPTPPPPVAGPRVGSATAPVWPG